MSSELTDRTGFLFLRNREEMATAWKAAVMIGKAPTLEPLLDGILSSLASTRNGVDKTASIYLAGPEAAVFRKELTDCLGVVAMSHGYSLRLTYDAVVLHDALINPDV